MNEAAICGDGDMFMIKNVILDIGGVLIDWNPDKAFRKFGYSDETICKIKAAVLAPKVWVEEDLSIKSPEELLVGFQRNRPECAEEIRYFWEHFDMSVNQYPDSKDWIREIKECGKKVYILSNFGRHCFDMLRNTKLDFMDMVDGGVISYEVHHVKPGREIYESLIEKYGLKTEESVFIDDREDNIVTAKMLGMNTILCRDREKTRQELWRKCDV